MSKVLFETLPLSPEVAKAIQDMDYPEATEIQSGSIPLIMEGHDVIGRSGTGTGKTAAFGIPAVESIKGIVNKTQVLVLCPTRELAMQITEEMRKYSKYKPNVKVAAIYGGQPMDRQIMQLRTANIVIGTPGRIMDHMRRRTLRLDDLKMVILDEADEMLNMGFYEDIQTILTEVPEERQTVLFSATIPPAILKITKEFQKDPKIVEVDNGQRTVDNIEQYFYQVPQARKMDALNLLLQLHNPQRSVVFCNTKRMVDDLVLYLNDNGFKSIGLHGDMKQAIRTTVMQNFKTGRIQILIATDVCARGIDVEDIDAVFNFDIPQEFEYYIHRIGRTGRAGKTGTSYTFACNSQQIRKIREIQRFIGADIVQQALPDAADILKLKQEKFAVKIRKAITPENCQPWEYLVDKLISEECDPRDLACALLSMIAGKDKKTVPVFKAPAVIHGEGAPGSGSRVCLRVDIGRDQRVAPNHIVGAIVEETGLPAKSIGKIDIFANYTNIDMTEQDANAVLEYMPNSTIRGYKATFTVTASKAFGGSSRPFAGKPRSSFGGGSYGSGGSSYGNKSRAPRKPYSAGASTPGGGSKMGYVKRKPLIKD